MPRARDLTGSKFGSLTVVRLAPKEGRGRRWECRCDCDATTAVLAGNLLNGNTTSCGCRGSRASIGDRTRTHGSTNAAEYNVWCKMRARCLSASSDQYQYYGGRGISICVRWSEFASFLADMGKRPSRRHTLDRIDTNGNYEPGNCRWADSETQSNNRRNNRKITYDGRSQTVGQWARELGMMYGTLWARLEKYGWDVRSAIETAVDEER